MLRQPQKINLPRDAPPEGKPVAALDLGRPPPRRPRRHAWSAARRTPTSATARARRARAACSARPTRTRPRSRVGSSPRGKQPVSSNKWATGYMRPCRGGVLMAVRGAGSSLERGGCSRSRSRGGRGGTDSAAARADRADARAGARPRRERAPRMRAANARRERATWLLRQRRAGGAACTRHLSGLARAAATRALAGARPRRWQAAPLCARSAPLLRRLAARLAWRSSGAGAVSREHRRESSAARREQRRETRPICELLLARRVAARHMQSRNDGRFKVVYRSSS
jgi:hypothetical protein